MEKKIFLAKLIDGVKMRLYDVKALIYRKLFSRCNGKRTSSMSAGKRKAVAFYSVFMILPVVSFCVFYVGVNLNSLMLAFKSYDIYTGNYSWIGFQNFEYVCKNLFNGNEMLGISLKNSLIVYAVALTVQIPLSLFFSYYIYKKKPLSGVYKVILFIPMIISTVVMVALFKIIVDRVFPDVVFMLTKKQVQGLLTNPSVIFGTIIGYYIWVGFGMGILVNTSAMSAISKEITEAAALDGASMMREFVSITIPMIFPTIATFLTISIAGIFTEQANLYTFYRDAANPRYYTIGYYLFVKVVGGDSTLSNYPDAAAMGILFSLFAIPVALFFKRIFEIADPSYDGKKETRV
jgi:ABC-type sugar transport system permease subunit